MNRKERLRLRALMRDLGIRPMHHKETGAVFYNAAEIGRALGWSEEETLQSLAEVGLESDVMTAPRTDFAEEQ